MKIAIFSNSYWNLFNFRLPIINELKKNNKIILIANKDLFYKKFFNKKNIIVKKLIFSSKSISIFDNISIFFNIFFLLKKEKPDLLITFTIKPNIYGSLAAQFLNIKTVNNITGLGTSFLNRNYFTLFIVFLFKISLKKSKIVFFHNSSEKKLFIKNLVIKRKQAKIINGSGVNIKNCKIKIFSKKKNTNNFIFSGRMIADKGIYELIEAIKIVKEYSSNSNFYFFGLLNVDNPGSISRTTIESWVNEGYINFSPNVKNVHKLLYKFDCFVMPSYSEGMSKSLLEAAAAGLPILCSNIPGCKEVVKNGRNGFLFNPKDIRSLSKAIIKFTHLPTHKRISFGKKSRSIINTNFDEKIITEKYSDYINELLI